MSRVILALVLFTLLLPTQECYVVPDLYSYGKIRKGSFSSLSIKRSNGWSVATTVPSQRRSNYYKTRPLRGFSVDGSTNEEELEAVHSKHSSEESEDEEDELTKEELQSAVDLYNTLPHYVRKVLRRAVTKSYNNKLNDLEPVNNTEVVLKLYRQRRNLMKYPSTWVRPSTMSTESGPLTVDATGTVVVNENNTMYGGKWGPLALALETKNTYDEALNSLTLGANNTKTELERFVESFFPPVTRKGKEFEPTEVDVSDIMTFVVGKDNFNPKSKPEKIPGGYVIRGTNRFDTGEALIDALDKRFEQYCTSVVYTDTDDKSLDIEEARRRASLRDRIEIFYCKDPTPEAMEDMTELFGESVLVLLAKDFSPVTSNRFVNIATTVLALCACFVFSIGCFGTTENVVQRMHATALSPSDHDLVWFNSLFFPLIGSISLIQVVHELGHLLVSWQGKVSVITKIMTTPSKDSFLFLISNLLLLWNLCLDAYWNAILK
jgi:hypothetical protein